MDPPDSSNTVGRLRRSSVTLDTKEQRQQQQRRQKRGRKTGREGKYFDCSVSHPREHISTQELLGMRINRLWDLVR